MAVTIRPNSPTGVKDYSDALVGIHNLLLAASGAATDPIDLTETDEFDMEMVMWEPIGEWDTFEDNELVYMVDRYAGRDTPVIAEHVIDVLVEPMDTTDHVGYDSDGTIDTVEVEVVYIQQGTTE